MPILRTGNAIPDVMYGYFGKGLLVNGAASPYKNCASGTEKCCGWVTREGRVVGIMGQFLIELNSRRQRSVNNRDK